MEFFGIISLDYIEQDTPEEPPLLQLRRSAIRGSESRYRVDRYKPHHNRDQHCSSIRCLMTAMPRKSSDAAIVAILEIEQEQIRSPVGIAV